MSVSKSDLLIFADVDSGIFTGNDVPGDYPQYYKKIDSGNVWLSLLNKSIPHDDGTIYTLYTDNSIGILNTLVGWEYLHDTDITE